jgi:hypothetical protein
MLALTSVRTVDNLFVPGNGEEVYDTVSGLIYRGNGYLPVGQLSPIQSVQQGLYIPGVAGNYVSSPDANIFDVPGDLCVVACIQGPNSGADAKFILSKWAPSNDTFYFYYQISTQQLVLTWSSDGATANYKISNQISITNKKWVAITFDVNNGSGGNTAIFWISPDGINWTPFSSDEQLVLLLYLLV